MYCDMALWVMVNGNDQSGVIIEDLGCSLSYRAASAALDPEERLNTRRPL